jgi:hypothetical protein
MQLGFEVRECRTGLGVTGERCQLYRVAVIVEADFAAPPPVLGSVLKLGEKKSWIKTIG